MTDEPIDVVRTKRWRGMAAMALIAGGMGVVTDRPLMVLVSAVAIGFVAYPSLTGRPEVDLDVERTVSESAPAHGAEVEVNVTLRNRGGLLSDVRFVDGVPPTLSVSEGTPRHATSLRPGGSTSFSYTVVAKRGRHSFVPATVLARNLSGSLEVETTAYADTLIDCASDIGDTELRKQATQYTGRVLTDQGGSGVEFHGAREYQRGDSISRIDWKRRARTGEFVTLKFREEKSARVMLVIDARKEAYVAKGEDEPSAVAYDIYATEQLFMSLQTSRDSVGVAVLGREFTWVPPGKGDEHTARTRRMLTTHPSLTPAPPRRDDFDESQLDELQKRLTNDTQIILLSPLADDFIVDVARRIDAHGNSVSVISPDLTMEDTPGQRLARVERDARLSDLYQSEIPVVDWEVEKPLAKVLAHTTERWSG
ncbi:MAG: DUF58 domain-containing protein [Halobacteriales archaeon]